MSLHNKTIHEMPAWLKNQPAKVELETKTFRIGDDRASYTAASSLKSIQDRNAFEIFSAEGEGKKGYNEFDSFMNEMNDFLTKLPSTGHEELCSKEFLKKQREIRDRQALET